MKMKFKVKFNLDKILIALFIVLSCVNFYFQTNNNINKITQNSQTNITSPAEISIIKHQDVDFVCFNLDNTKIHIEKSLYDNSPNTYNAISISQNFEYFKKIIKDKFDLDYNYNIPIYIVDDNSTKFVPKEQGANFNSQDATIHVKTKYFFQKEDGALAHEMIHVILYKELKDSYPDLPLWLNEGIATQVNPNDMFVQDYNKNDVNRLLQQFEYPQKYEDTLKYYSIHKKLIEIWITSKGTDVLKQFIELVKNGETPLMAFTKLGGNDAVNTLKNSVS